MITKINFELNGQKYFTNKVIRLADLISYFNYGHQLLILEHNKRICNEDTWENILITDSDKIEIVTIVGGG